MIRVLKLVVFVLSLSVLFSCDRDGKLSKIPKTEKPSVRNQGQEIEFPHDTATLNYFKTYMAGKENITADFAAPARVIASVVTSDENESEDVILFDNPDLTATYSSFLQHEINIEQYKLALARTKDLYEHGSASGKELLEAKTALSNEQAAIIEHEAKLRLAGLRPEELKKAQPGEVWLICDIPENQIGKLKTGQTCKVTFNSFPGQTFKGIIDDLGEVVDNVTRMIKVRITVNNPEGKFRAGMFSSVNFGIAEGNFIDIPKSSIVTVQGKDFVFIKKNNVFVRTEVVSGQQVNDKVIIYSGLNDGDLVVTEGTMQLKGLSFGY
jgi:multidrug efflux pump subunit AcrA (membrane-fusion protein)